MPTAYRIVDSTIIKVPCENNVVKNDLVYIGRSNGIAGKSDASTVNKMPVRGIVVKKVGNYAFITESLKITRNDLAFSEGTVLYASTGTLGSYQTANPTIGVKQPIGKALPNNEIIITINPHDATIL